MTESTVPSQRRKMRLREVEGLGPNPTAGKQLTEELCLGPRITSTAFPILLSCLHRGAVARFHAATGPWNQGYVCEEKPSQEMISLLTLLERGHTKL